MSSTGKLIIAGALCIVVGFFVWEGYLSDEARMERFLDSMTTPAESLELARVMASFSDDYTDSFEQDKDLLANRLAEGFSRVESLNITISDIQASFDEDQASGEFALVVVARQGAERLLVVGTPLQPQRLGITLVRSDDSWQVQRIERKMPQEMPAP